MSEPEFCIQLFENSYLGMATAVLWLLAVVVSIAILVRGLLILIRQKKPVKDMGGVGMFSIMGTRHYQQDSAMVFSGPEGLLGAVVCDGMGGMHDGARASTTAVKMIADVCCHSCSPEQLAQVMHEADHEVACFMDEQGRDIDSGTTACAAVVQDGKLLWASVGDSRIYLFQFDRLRRLTRDHNYALTLSEMVNRGEITQEQADAEGQHEALISYIGMGGLELVDVHWEPDPMMGGEIILVCSDGVTKLATDVEIEALLRENVLCSAREISEAVVRYTEEKRSGAQDNTTAAVIKIPQDNVGKENAL